MNISSDDMSLVLGIGRDIATVAVWVYVWWTQRKKATADQFRAVDKRLDSLDNEMVGMKKELEHAPTQTDIKELSNRIQDLHGDLNKVVGGLEGIRRAVDIMNSHLLERGK